MASDGNFALNDFGETSHIQIHVAGDYYSGHISNSAVGGRGNSVSIQNIASKNIDVREELQRVTNWLTNQNFQDGTVDEQSRFKEWTKFREWLEKDEATLSLKREVPGTLSLSEMPRVEMAIKILDELIPSAPSAESKIFNVKMLGDCYRYLAQFGMSDMYEDNATKSWEAYKEASRIIDTAELAPTDPLRLGLAMSRSLFYYEIVKDPERAASIVHQAWTNGSAEIANITEEDWKDSITMLQRVRFSLTLWVTEMAEAEGDDTELDDSADQP